VDEYISTCFASQLINYIPDAFIVGIVLPYAIINPLPSILISFSFSFYLNQSGLNVYYSASYSYGDRFVDDEVVEVVVQS
jgi:ABC-type uncharacterized transport system permease subunit